MKKQIFFTAAICCLAFSSCASAESTLKESLKILNFRLIRQ